MIVSMKGLNRTNRSLYVRLLKLQNRGVINIYKADDGSRAYDDEEFKQYHDNMSWGRPPKLTKDFDRWTVHEVLTSNDTVLRENLKLVKQLADRCNRILREELGE